MEGKLEAHLSQSCVTEEPGAPPQGLSRAKMGKEGKRTRQPAFQGRLDKDTKKKTHATPPSPGSHSRATEQWKKERKTETAHSTRGAEPALFKTDKVNECRSSVPNRTKT